MLTDLLTKNKGTGNKFTGLLSDTLNISPSPQTKKNRFFASADQSLELHKASPKLNDATKKRDLLPIGLSPDKGSASQVKKIAQFDKFGAQGDSNNENTIDQPACPVHSQSSKSKPSKLGMNFSEENSDASDSESLLLGLKVHHDPQLLQKVKSLTDFNLKNMANCSTEPKTDSKPNDGNLAPDFATPHIPSLDFSSIIESRNRKNRAILDKK